jgi:hydrogenase maturation protein HypF
MRWTNQIFLKKIPLPFKIRKPVLACGAQAKNTLCFAKGNTAYISRIRPDLSIRDDLLGFEKDLHCLLKKKPGILACDLHPEYQSTKFAQRLSTAGYQLSAIQHHHAHIASCMAENGLEGQKIIGVAFDGTGWGDDGRLWGAEFLICDYKNFKRAAHLKEIPLLGLEMAIREPWRLAAAWLTLSGLNLPRALKNKDWRILKYMFKRGINSPAVSSMGRLFDAAAVLILKKIKASFEAELAIALEKNAAAFGVADTLTA